MNNIVFQSNLFFEVMDFSLTHKVLLLRGIEIEEKDNQYVSHKNIDILFGGVHFMTIPTSFDGGIIIKKGINAKELSIDGEKVYLEANQYFEIQNLGITYYIKSYGIEISNNTLDSAESSIDGKKFRSLPKEQVKYNIEEYAYHLVGVRQNISQVKDWNTLTIEVKEAMIKYYCEPFSVSSPTISTLINSV